MADLSLDKLRILNFPDPRLRQVCSPVAEFGPHLDRLGRRMLELMRAAEGIGLAAPQVGLDLRLFVCNTTGDPKDDRIVINPELVDLEGEVESEEGCLSIPEVTVRLRRAAWCILRAVDAHGRPFEQPAADLAARCWQHECDHLDGRLIVDYMSAAEKIANRKKLRELEAEYKARSKMTPARRR